MAQSPIETLGVVTFLLMNSREHQDLTLAQMRRMVLPPLDHGLAVTAKGKTGADGQSGEQPIAFALFARVSEEWDAALRAPDFELVNLPQEAWTSGDHQWLLLLVGRQGVTAKFAQEAAKALFKAGSTVNIRLRDDAGGYGVREVIV